MREIMPWWIVRLFCLAQASVSFEIHLTNGINRAESPNGTPKARMVFIAAPFQRSPHSTRKKASGEHGVIYKKIKNKENKKFFKKGLQLKLDTKKMIYILWADRSYFTWSRRPCHLPARLDFVLLVLIPIQAKFLASRPLSYSQKLNVLMESGKGRASKGNERKSPAKS